MEFSRQQQIQNLVKSAEILSAPEKNEWLELMDLMNDHQLLELERILLDVRKAPILAPSQPSVAVIAPTKREVFAIPERTRKDSQVATVPLAVAAKPPVTPPVVPPAAAKKLPPAVPVPPKPPAGAKPPESALSGPGKQTSPFSHILNFPKAPGLAGPPKLKSTQGSPSSLTDKMFEPKKDSKFLAKLKGIFAEKELPGVTLSELPPPSKIVAKPKVQEPLPALVRPMAVAKLRFPEKKPEQKPKPEPKPALKLAPTPPPALTPKPAPKPVPPVLPSPSRPAPAEAGVSQGGPVSPSTSQGGAPKPENVTINVFVNSPEERAKVPGLSKAQEALDKILGQPPAGQAPKAQTPEPKPEPKPLPPAVTPSPSPASPAPAEASAGQAGPPKPQTQPAPTITQSYNIISPSNIVAPARAVASAPPLAAPVALPEIEEEDLPEETEPEQPKEPDKKTYPTGSGAKNLPEEADADKSKDKETGLPKPKPVVPLNRVVLEEKPGDTMNLESLADVDRLQPEDLQKHATGTIFRKIQKLVGQFGQHEVVFHLEKSPLYKAYIDSGITWLKEGGKVSTTPSQLPPVDFERFADLLIVMRSRA